MSTTTISSPFPLPFRLLDGTRKRVRFFASRPNYSRVTFSSSQSLIFKGEMAEWSMAHAGQ